MPTTRWSPLPYGVLCALLVLAAMFGLLYAVFPPTAQTPRIVDAVGSLGLLGVAGLTWVLAPRFPNDSGLDASLALAAGGTALATAAMPTAYAQVSLGLALVVYAGFAGYFRPLSRVIMHLVWMSGLYLTGLLLNPLLPGWLNTLAVISTAAVAALVLNALNTRLHHLALHDPLTGTLNRAGLETQSGLVSALTNRSGVAITVGLIDLDQFKEYNDTHGHRAGDQLLVDLTTAWSTQLRVGDLLARYGGDEFVLVLPGSDLDSASRLTERLHHAHEAPWTIGFSSWEPREDLYQAVDRADRAMYARKEAPE